MSWLIGGCLKMVALLIKSKQVLSITHSHGAQQQTLHDWSGLPRCWGQTHDTDVHSWGGQERMTTLKNVWGAILEVKWRLFELLNQKRPATQALANATCAQQNCPKVQTLSGPSNACWVQSSQRMPWPHYKLLLRWSRPPLHKYTTVTSFTIYWLYNGIKVAMWLPK